MRVSRTPSLDPCQDDGARQIPSVAYRATGKPDSGRRRGCGDVARKRAARYGRQRRIPKPLWPLIAAVILFALVFERRPFPASSSTEGRATANDGRASLRLMSGEDLNIDRFPRPDDAGSAAGGVREPHHRPPSDFLARDAAQVIAFLIRNRGKLDTEAVRKKWQHLDEFCLPLAVYLRDIEASGDWSVLEHEVAAFPIPLRPKPLRRDAPSVRHSRIRGLIPEWVRRGEVLLAPLNTDLPAPDASSDHQPDDDDTPPQPTRR